MTDTGTVRPTPELRTALDERNVSYSDLVEALHAAGVPTSKSLVGQIVKDGAPTSTVRADAIAAYLDVPAARLFRHKNGDIYGGAL